MTERQFKGIWIPKEIWLSEELTLQEKVFLVEIESLDNDHGCFASNEYFAKFFGLSKNRCSEVIKSLEAKKWLTIEYKFKKGSKAIEKRIIRGIRFSEGGIRDVDRGIRDVEGGYSEKCEDNNTCSNNTNNNNTSNKENNVVLHTTLSPNDELIDVCINYLNSKTNKKFRTTTKEYRRLINARINEGATPDQLKYVIDVKCLEWLDNEKMKHHLTPTTLFREGNFDRYVNQPMRKLTVKDLVKAGKIDIRNALR